MPGHDDDAPPIQPTPATVAVLPYARSAGPAPTWLPIVKWLAWCALLLALRRLVVFVGALPQLFQAASWASLAFPKTVDGIALLVAAAAWVAIAWAAVSLLSKPSPSAVRMMRYGSLVLTLTWAILLVRQSLEYNQERYIAFRSFGEALLSNGSRWLSDYLPWLLLLAITWHPACTAMLGARRLIADVPDRDALDQPASSDEPWARDAMRHLVRVLSSIAVLMAAPALLLMARTLFVLQVRLSWTQSFELFTNTAPTLNAMAEDISALLLATGGVMLLARRRAGRRVLLAGAVLLGARRIILTVVSLTYIFFVWSAHRRDWLYDVSSLTHDLPTQVMCALLVGIFTRKIVRDHINANFRDLITPPPAPSPHSPEPRS
jgi:hypothetical protein